MAELRTRKVTRHAISRVAIDLTPEQHAALKEQARVQHLTVAGLMRRWMQMPAADFLRAPMATALLIRVRTDVARMLQGRAFLSLRDPSVPMPVTELVALAPTGDGTYDLVVRSRDLTPSEREQLRAVLGPEPACDYCDDHVPLDGGVHVLPADPEGLEGSARIPCPRHPA